MLVTGLTKRFGAQALFDGLGFRLEPGQRLAVVGPNGAGKTTLLRILAGQLEPDAGEVVLPRGAHVALHDQRPPLHRDITLGDYVVEGLSGVRDAEAALATIEAQMAAGDHGAATLARYERARENFERLGGYGWHSRLERVIRGLGVDAEALDRPLTSFSGGELTRASLARSLAGQPDVLLLDEPTNHLDLTAVEWLESAVTDIAATIVVVSHDRWFLESIATHVLELDRGRAKLWSMGYSAFRRERALAMDRQSAEAERQAKEIERLERFVSRWSAGTRSRQATSRRRALDRIERVAAPTRAAAIAFGFPKSEPVGRVVLDVDNLTLTAGERTLVTGAGFAVERHQRIAILGPNGAGKTTLLETLIGLRQPTKGRITLGHRVRPGYFSQHAAELPRDRTVLESVLADTPITSAQARTLLGRFLFTGDLVERRLEQLSGGERRRVSLVRLIAQGGNLLVLDEPTNHLDVESREALEEALIAYDGTLLVVSHDRALIDLVATHTLSVEDERLVLRTGGYLDFVAAKEVPVAAPQSPKRAPRPSKPPSSSPSKRPRRRLSTVEARIAELEAELEGVGSELADPAIGSDRERLAERATRYREIERELAVQLREWEAVAEAAPR